MTELYDRAAEGDGAALAAAARRQEELEARGFYEVDTRVEKAAAGLGLAELGLDRPVGELSGGQRAKLLLARLLLEEPDVLLLDEPTNFLDQEQAAWLADTLTGLERAFLVVSHDAAFLNRAVTAVCAVEGRRLTKYPGNYAAYQAKKECLGSASGSIPPSSGRSRGRRPISAKPGGPQREDGPGAAEEAGPSGAAGGAGGPERPAGVRVPAAARGPDGRPGGGGTVGRVPQSGAGGAGPLRACRTEGGADRV